MYMLPTFYSQSYEAGYDCWNLNLDLCAQSSTIHDMLVQSEPVKHDPQQTLNSLVVFENG